MLKVLMVKDILDMFPNSEYYTADQVRTWWGGRGALKLTELLDTDIPVENVLQILNVMCSDCTWMRLFTCDCAEHVLPYFEKVCKDSTYPHDALKGYRRYIQGRGTVSQVEKAKASALRAIYHINYTHQKARKKAWSAAVTMYECAPLGTEWRIAAITMEQAIEAGGEKEREWQLKTLRACLTNLVN